MISGLLIVISAKAQHKRHGGSCDSNTSCFKTDITKVEKISESCTAYEFKVFLDGRCDHALSHYSVAIPCGTVKDLQNSQNWKQVFGTDPKTQLTGFKIDDIPNFGETSLKSFTVSFTRCTTDACAEELKCWQPIVAYKAATKVTYDTLQLTCPTTPTLKANIQKTDVTCYGGSNGSLTVTAEEGTAPYSYLWSTGDTTAAVNDVAAGTYSVLVEDARGDTVSVQATIMQPTAISIAGTTNNATCAGSLTGAIDVTVTGGKGGYTFGWNNGATTEDLAALKAGSYLLTVKDSTGCSAQKVFTIANATTLSLSVTSVMPTCTQANGSIDLTITGGVGPYTYTWSTGNNTEDLSNVGVGLYKVSVTDSQGCTAELSYNLRENNTLRIAADVTQTSCTDDASGAINISVSGGTSPYTNSWSNGTTAEDLTNLIAGLYRVTVTDANGCTITMSFNVTKKTFTAGQTLTQPLCNGSATGSITLNPAGGTAPYTYQWSNGATSNSLSDLAAGVYSVTITDASGCTKQFTFIISNPPVLSANASFSSLQCGVDGSYAIDLSVNGGKGPYSYIWSNGATTEDLSGLNSGTYTVTIKDASGCTLTKEVSITPSTSAINATAQVSSLQCGAEGSYTINLDVSGGSAPYTYQWSNGATTEDLNGLNTGTYTVVITDATGCSITKEVVVTATASGVACAITPLDSIPVCGTTGITMTTSVVADSYQWSVQSTDGSWTITSSTTAAAIAFTAGNENSAATFTLVVTKDGCSQTCTYAITTCTSADDNGGGGGNGGGDGENDGSCETCFESDVKVISQSGSCTTYEAKISTDGSCSHDLSHWTIGVPCGSISNYWNSEGWKMSIGKDPTTGVYGLKVDDINDFGKTAEYFTVKFTVCRESSCDDDWSPIVAYKAGLCIAYDTLGTQDGSAGDNEDGGNTEVCGYPNPFKDKIHFKWTSEHDEYVEINICDKDGREVSKVYKGHVRKGEEQNVECDASALNEGMYFYRFNCSKSGSRYGKILKTR